MAPPVMQNCNLSKISISYSSDTLILHFLLYTSAVWFDRDLFMLGGNFSVTQLIICSRIHTFIADPFLVFLSDILYIS